MRKMRLFLAAATFCSAIAVGYSAYTNATMTQEQRLILANIEALSSGGEGEYSCTVTVNCAGNSGSVSCTGTDCERGGSVFSYTWVKCDGKKTEC